MALDFVEKKNRLQIRVSQLVYMFLLANCMTYIYSNMRISHVVTS